jgi:hypothetical protein
VWKEVIVASIKMSAGVLVGVEKEKLSRSLAIVVHLLPKVL